MAKQKAHNHIAEESLNQLADRLAREAEKIMKTAKSEEDLRVHFENALKPVLTELNITYGPKFEHSIYQAGRTLSTEDIRHYTRISTALTLTLALQTRIDKLYPKAEESFL